MPSLDPGATTFGELTDEIIANLQGYVRDQEAATHLTSSLNDSDTQASVNDVSKGSGVGAIEIEDEILWVQQVDRTNNTITIAPYGRGYQGTDAAEHDANVRVTFAPRFPRFRVKRAINQTIASIGDQLPAVGNYEFTADPVIATYQVPADVEQVLDARWQTVGPSQEWYPIRNWNVNVKANTTAFTTGVSMDIGDPMVPGQDVRITYVKNPTMLSASADLFTATGYAASVYDVIVYGTMARLVAPVEAARLDFKSVEADQLDAPTQFGSGQSLSKYFQQMFLMRLAEERQKYFERFQPRIRRMM